MVHSSPRYGGRAKAWWLHKCAEAPLVVTDVIGWRWTRDVRVFYVLGKAELVTSNDGHTQETRVGTCVILRDVAYV
jgi:hypothetical protein